MGTFVVPYLTLYLAQDRELSLANTGQVIAAGGVGMLLGNLAGGWLADRTGRKPTLLLALTTNIIGITTLAFALPSATSYALALALALAGAGMYTPAANAWIADLTSETQRPLAFTVNYICINVGMGLGPLLGGLLAAASFRWLFVGEVATTLVCMGVIAGAPTGQRPATAKTPVTTAGSAVDPWTWIQREAAHWRSPAAVRLLAFCGASFFVIAPLMGLEYVVPLLVGTVLHQPLVLVGLVYSINAACILALGLPIERLLRGRDPLLMMAGAGALWTAGLAILTLGLTAGALLACTLVWTLGEIVGSIVIPTYVSQRISASVRGRFLALPDAMRSLAAIVAPLVLGMVWDRQGVDTVMVVLVATPALGAALYMGAWSKQRFKPAWGSHR